MDRITLNEESQARWNAENAEHLRFDYPLKSGDVVIDIGAYRGEFAIEIKARYPEVKIVMFEPTAGIVGCQAGEVVNKAAWLYNGKETFGGAYLYTSILEPGNTEYECIDLIEALAPYEKIALCKMNIEGGEYALLNHLIAGGVHRRIDNLQVQFHQVAGTNYAALYGQIFHALQITHHLEWRYPFCWESWRLN